MKTLKRISELGIVALSCLVSAVAHADLPAWTPEPQTIKFIHTGHSASEFYVMTGVPSSIVSSCANNTIYQFNTADTNQDRQKRAYAAALLAAATGKKIYLYITSCTSFPRFDAILVEN